MARFARPLQYLGIVIAVFGLGKFHAVRHEYDYTGSTRFGWSFAFVVLLGVSRTRLGLPELLRSRRAAWTASLTACAAAALGISVAQLVTNSVLLPTTRRVRCGSGARTLVRPLRHAWHDTPEAEPRTASASSSSAVPTRATCSATSSSMIRSSRRSSLPCSAAQMRGRPAMGSLSSTAASASHATLLVLDREAQADEHIVAQAALLHERGARVRTVSLFYEQWLGKLPIAELERVSLMFDIGEVHRDSYSRVKRLIDIVLALVCLPVLAVALPVVALANRAGNRGSLFFRQSRVGKVGPRVHDLEVSNDEGATGGSDAVDLR